MSSLVALIKVQDTGLFSTGNHAHIPWSHQNFIIVKYTGSLV